MTTGTQTEEVVHDGYRWVTQACPICNVKPTRFVGSRGGDAHRQGLGVRCEIWQCGTCGMIFPDPMPVPLGGLSQHYATDADEFFANHDPQEKINTARLILDDAESMTGGKGTLLDIGAGRGETLKLALERGWTAVGIETSETFAAYAEKSAGARLYTKPIEECGFPAEEFDVVILSAVLEHLYEPRSMLAEVSRVLKPGGLLFVDVPNERGLVFKMGNLYQRLRGRTWCVNLSPTFPPFHLFGFSPGALKTMLAQEGFDLKKMLVFGGESVLEDRGNLIGKLEVVASVALTTASKFGNMGSYIAAWAQKR